MSEHELDALLKERFDGEHRHVPAEPFMADTKQKIRAARRLRAGVGTALRVAALVAAIIASPWLISGGRWLTTTLGASFSWAAGLPGTWVLGVLAVAVVLWSRVRR